MKNYVCTGLGVAGGFIASLFGGWTEAMATLTADGMTRTVASDDAVANLTGRGWTISGITKV